MTQGSALLEKEAAGAARNERLELKNPFDMETGLEAASIKKLSEMDRILEGTLSGAASHEALSKREKQVLQLILTGNTNREIATKIYRTERTVEYHRNRLMHKLGSHTPAELVKHAIAMGLA